MITSKVSVKVNYLHKYYRLCIENCLLMLLYTEKSELPCYSLGAIHSFGGLASELLVSGWYILSKGNFLCWFSSENQPLSSWYMSMLICPIRPTLAFVNP